MAVLFSHQMSASLDGSLTVCLSFGVRPVYLPVRETSAPFAASWPSPLRIACSISSAVERLKWAVVLERSRVVAVAAGDDIVALCFPLWSRQAGTKIEWARGARGRLEFTSRESGHERAKVREAE